ncbi:uncharacterized protein PHALS_14816 [Plasmopara halstedii]|uniref:Uncharacterized protein n=1 Tax=Plasmopara halstedii TaxID=4781 RepID=A0A0P1AWE8_PLAHL|nr:uncharacterized protein PHALS_14816 [Plasmopara halstedii]CEG45494.1 hypothetical protein PHALS_14816 [Plasmopara halstedii]|eukprot:XP_024581863.1 hypothetical protein PHALS_14816 [Plasmopara halstedii]
MCGLVEAFVGSITLLRQTDICYPNGSKSSNYIAVASLFQSHTNHQWLLTSLSLWRLLFLHQKIFDVVLSITFRASWRWMKSEF